LGHSILTKSEFGVLVFVECGKPENLEENPQNKAKADNKLNLCLEAGWNQMQATLMRGKHSHLRVTNAVF